MSLYHLWTRYNTSCLFTHAYSPPTFLLSLRNHIRTSHKIGPWSHRSEPGFLTRYVMIDCIRRDERTLTTLRYSHCTLVPPFCPCHFCDIRTQEETNSDTDEETSKRIRCKGCPIEEEPILPGHRLDFWDVSVPVFSFGARVP